MPDALDMNSYGKFAAHYNSRSRALPNCAANIALVYSHRATLHWTRRRRAGRDASWCFSFCAQGGFLGGKTICPAGFTKPRAHRRADCSARKADRAAREQELTCNPFWTKLKPRMLAATRRRISKPRWTDWPPATARCCACALRKIKRNGNRDAVGHPRRRGAKNARRGAGEKIAKFLRQRGVTLTTTAIAEQFRQISVSRLARRTSCHDFPSTALSGTAITTAAVIAATKAIAMTTFQKTIVTAALVVTVRGAGVFEAHKPRNCGDKINHCNSSKHR